MQEATTAVAKSIGTASLSAAFSLTPWAVAAALVGAAAGLYTEDEGTAKGIFRRMLGIAALGFFAAMIAAGVPHVPHLMWTDSIPVAVRAGFLGFIVNPTNRYVFQPGIKLLGAWLSKRYGGT